MFLDLNQGEWGLLAWWISPLWGCLIGNSCLNQWSGENFKALRGSWIISRSWKAKMDGNLLLLMGRVFKISCWDGQIFSIFPVVMRVHCTSLIVQGVFHQLGQFSGRFFQCVASPSTKWLLWYSMLNSVLRKYEILGENWNFKSHYSVNFFVRGKKFSKSLEESNVWQIFPLLRSNVWLFSHHAPTSHLTKTQTRHFRFPKRPMIFPPVAVRNLIF